MTRNLTHLQALEFNSYLSIEGGVKQLVMTSWSGDIMVLTKHRSGPARLGAPGPSELQARSDNDESRAMTDLSYRLQ